MDFEGNPRVSAVPKSPRALERRIPWTQATKRQQRQRSSSASCAARARPSAWAAGFVAAKHGIPIGFTPADLAFHRFFWSGLLLIPLVLREGIADLGGIGWRRGW